MSYVQRERWSFTMRLPRLNICGYIRDETTKHNARASIADGVAFSVMAGLTQPFWGAFAAKLGATDYMLALLSSLPALVALLSQIPAAMIVDKSDTRLRPTLVAAVVTRLSYIAFAFLAVLPSVSHVNKAWAFILIFALRNFPGTVCDTAWTSMMGEMFEPRLRGRVFSERNMLTTLFALMATVAAGPFLDAVPWPWNYGALYLVSFVAVMVSVYYLASLKEPAEHGTEHSQRLVGFRAFVSVAGDKTFLMYLFAVLLLNTGFHIPSGLWTILWVKTMKLSNFWLGAFSIASGVASFVSYPSWGRWSEKYGTMKTLAAGAMGHMFFPLLYGQFRSPLVHLAIHIVNGFVGAGFGLASFNALLDISPAPRRPAYIAAYNTMHGLSAFVWPFAGVWLYKQLGLTPTLNWVFVIRLITMSVAGALLSGKLALAAKQRTQEAV